MQDQRKTIIVKEIAYWKENKMLPEHYCDYLLTLYTEGNGVEENTISKKRSGFLLSSLLFFSFIPITIFLLYFTELSFILQMAISLIFLIFCFVGIFLYNKKQLNVDIPATVAAIIFLLFSVAFVLYFFVNKIIFLYIILFLNCLFWYICGKRFKLLYFTISAYIGACLLVILVVSKYMFN
ncbi:hypothetical protein M1D49_09455 [Bacillus sp. PK3-056]|jgi:hypothetical protein|uniref:Uncharacterized protein n=1 Tax=Niallia circulans TaxID=1397 RepID=A0AA91TNN5_NIACI|nr:hypothetical protein [Niallia circulans]AYV74563.1 hypothetical protein C2H98_25015 [Niallia circulans]PAD80921.1 hypothetical protein CHH57_22440 [Niallia circulans]QJX63127.1 hypothetical protein HLK66_16680 [Niallia circulans]